jgi:hypothetical protein
MVLKEYPAIKKNGKTVVDKTCPYNLIVDFCEQMTERENTMLSFYVNRKLAKSDNPKDRMQSCGICWSEEFTMDDMINLILNYTDMCLNDKEKIFFVTQLQNIFVSESMAEDEEDED